MLYGYIATQPCLDQRRRKATVRGLAQCYPLEVWLAGTESHVLQHAVYSKDSMLCTAAATAGHVARGGCLIL